MKKHIILSLIIGFSSASYAQEQEFKPIAGNTSLEINFDPSALFSSTGSVFVLPHSGIKFRKWKSEKLVYRMTVQGSVYNTETNSLDNNSINENVNLKAKTFDWTLVLRPGFEHHFKGTKRLSPYVGGEIILGVGTHKKSYDTLFGDSVINELDTYGSISLGASALAGFDYYITESIYLGLELNYSINYYKGFKQKIEYNGSPDPMYGANPANKETPGNSSFSFAPSIVGVLRLGWNF